MASEKTAFKNFQTTTRDAQNLLSFSVQVVGVILVVLNLWLVTKLAPIEKNQAVLANDVKHNTENIRDIKGDIRDILTILRENYVK